MATEYGLQEGDNHAELARELLDRAGDPSKVTWVPRPDTPGGGVYLVDDDQAAADVLRARQLRVDGEQQRIEESQQLADERDRKAAKTGLTPAELGFPANTGTDPGSAAQAQQAADAAEGKLKNEGADPNPAAVEKSQVITTKTDAASTDEDAEIDADEEDADDATDDGADEAPKRQTPAQRRAAAKQAREAEAAKRAAADDAGKDSEGN